MLATPTRPTPAAMVRPATGTSRISQPTARLFPRHIPPPARISGIILLLILLLPRSRPLAPAYVHTRAQPRVTTCHACPPIRDLDTDEDEMQCETTNAEQPNSQGRGARPRSFSHALSEEGSQSPARHEWSPAAMIPTRSDPAYAGLADPL